MEAISMSPNTTDDTIASPREMWPFAGGSTLAADVLLMAQHGVPRQNST